MNVNTKVNSVTSNFEVMLEMSKNEFDAADPKSLIWKALENAAADLAKTYIRDHQDEVLAQINPQAVANLAIADSARLIREKFIDPTERREQ